MPYGECKVYSDGSHYIAIPHTENKKRRRKHKHEAITVSEKDGKLKLEKTPSVKLIEDDDEIEPVSPVQVSFEEVIAEAQKKPEKPPDEPPKRTTTRKQIFEDLYIKYNQLPYRQKKKAILSDMQPLFKTEQAAVSYVQENLDRKRRNLIARRVRLTRKVNLQEFNYFVTFTYDGEKHTEESFKKGIKTCLRNFGMRKDWKYIGVWERSPEKQRLHFHGLFNIPQGTMPGAMVEKNDYNFNTHRRQITMQNTYFNEKFGRSDFEEITDKHQIGGAISYIVKYIEKSGERIVCSKGLPQYFISDIMDEDIICPTGLEDKKLLLYDDFRCWDEGCLVGNVSDSVIKQMRKSN